MHSTYGSNRHGGTLSEKGGTFFATLTANCGQVFNLKTSNPYISELVLGRTPHYGAY